MTVDRPIIVTALMGKQDFQWADSERRRYFPPARNLVPAHITLFHHLPPSCELELLHRLSLLCEGPRPNAQLEKAQFLGSGVAYRVRSPELLSLRAELADAFDGLLIPQDRAKPALHITIQNKVPREQAAELYTEKAAAFTPRPLCIAGLSAWRYCGGPWQAIRDFTFRG